MTQRILLIAGTRPNFIKLAPLYHRLREHQDTINVKTCHTGQHFDSNMSDVFWEALELPQPDYMLNVQGTNVPDTIGKSIIAINDLLSKESFDLIVVFGDVNATVSGAIVGAQSSCKVMHVEAGLRSFDNRMPEETNRVITDHISDYLMVSEPSGIENLKREGVSDDKVFYVGNIMIECLIKTESKWSNIQFDADLRDRINDPFVLCTFHRPENVDNRENLERIVELINSISEDQVAILPMHPRTRNKLEELGLNQKLADNPNLVITSPLPYFEFVKLLSQCDFVLTDSGGIQEESSYFGNPCVTIRNNTERPVTTSIGTNLLANIGDKNLLQDIRAHVKKIKGQEARKIELWDGDVSARILKVIQTL